MLEWFQTNAVSIAVVAVLALIVTAVIFKMVKDKKKGRSSCGGNCQSCGMGCGCHISPDQE